MSTCLGDSDPLANYPSLSNNSFRIIDLKTLNWTVLQAEPCLDPDRSLQFLLDTYVIALDAGFPCAFMREGFSFEQSLDGECCRQKIIVFWLLSHQLQPSSLGRSLQVSSSGVWTSSTSCEYLDLLYQGLLNLIERCLWKSSYVRIGQRFHELVCIDDQFFLSEIGVVFKFSKSGDYVVYNADPAEVKTRYRMVSSQDLSSSFSRQDATLFSLLDCSVCLTGRESLNDYRDASWSRLFPPPPVIEQHAAAACYLEPSPSWLVEVKVANATVFVPSWFLFISHACSTQHDLCTSRGFTSGYTPGIDSAGTRARSRLSPCTRVQKRDLDTKAVGDSDRTFHKRARNTVARPTLTPNRKFPPQLSLGTQTQQGASVFTMEATANGTSSEINISLSSHATPLPSPHRNIPVSSGVCLTKDTCDLCMEADPVSLLGISTSRSDPVAYPLRSRLPLDLTECRLSMGDWLKSTCSSETQSDDNAPLSSTTTTNKDLTPIVKTLNSRDDLKRLGETKSPRTLVVGDRTADTPSASSPAAVSTWNTTSAAAFSIPSPVISPGARQVSLLMDPRDLKITAADLNQLFEASDEEDCSMDLPFGMEQFCTDHSTDYKTKLTSCSPQKHQLHSQIYPTPPSDDSSQHSSKTKNASDDVPTYCQEDPFGPILLMSSSCNPPQSLSPALVYMPSKLGETPRARSTLQPKAPGQRDLVTSPLSSRSPRETPPENGSQRGAGTLNLFRLLMQKDRNRPTPAPLQSISTFTLYRNFPDYLSSVCLGRSVCSALQKTENNVSEMYTRQVLAFLGRTNDCVRNGIDRRWFPVKTHGEKSISRQSRHAHADQTGRNVSPTVIVNLGEDQLSISPNALRLWDKIGLSPVSSARNILYLAICPDVDTHVSTARMFFKELSSTFSSCQLGRLLPCSKTIKDWIIRVPCSQNTSSTDPRQSVEACTSTYYSAVKGALRGQVARFLQESMAEEVLRCTSVRDINPISVGSPAPLPSSTSTCSDETILLALDGDDTDVVSAEPPDLCIYVFSCRKLGQSSAADTEVVREFLSFYHQLPTACRSPVFLQLLDLDRVSSMMGVFSGAQAAVPVSTWLRDIALATYTSTPYQIRTPSIRNAIGDLSDTSDERPNRSFLYTLDLPRSHYLSDVSSLEELELTLAQSSTVCYHASYVVAEPGLLLAMVMDQRGSCVDTTAIQCDRSMEDVVPLAGLRSLLQFFNNSLSSVVSSFELDVTRIGQLTAEEVNGWAALLSIYFSPTDCVACSGLPKCYRPLCKTVSLLSAIEENWYLQPDLTSSDAGQSCRVVVLPRCGSPTTPVSTSHTVPVEMQGVSPVHGYMDELDSLFSLLPVPPGISPQDWMSEEPGSAVDSNQSKPYEELVLAEGYLLPSDRSIFCTAHGRQHSLRVTMNYHRSAGQSTEDSLFAGTHSNHLRSVLERFANQRWLNMEALDCPRNCCDLPVHIRTLTDALLRRAV